MKKAFVVTTFILICASLTVSQPATATLIQIVKAEDARRYDTVLENLIGSPDQAVQTRAVLAAGRIGDDRAVPALSAILDKGQSEPLRAMAAFALGEIESVKAAASIIAVLNDPQTPNAVRARAIEAAGKIAAANPKDPSSKHVGEAILKTLDNESRLGAKQYRDTVLLGLTAAGRTGGLDPRRKRPDDTDFITAEFLKSPDARIRADAANTLARLRATFANVALQTMLQSDGDAVARSNAAHALGAAGDTKAFDLLLKAAVGDPDLRVRVSAIRSLGILRDPKAADKLLGRGEKLLSDYKRSKFANPTEKNELIEIATVLGTLLRGTANERAAKFLGELAILDDGRTPEISIARMQVKPGDFANSRHRRMDWRQLSTDAQIAAQLATIESKSVDVIKMRAEAPKVLKLVLERFSEPGAGDDKLSAYAMPDYLRAYAAFKPADLATVLRANLQQRDVILRATAAELLTSLPASKENVDALKRAFDFALLKDKDYDDAQLGILDALYKVNKKEAVGTLLIALAAPDYLVRKKAFELLSDKDLQKDFPGIPTSLEYARSKKKDQVLPYTGAFGTKLGQVLNTDADYRRAVLRKNGSVNAVITTEKGAFTIDLMPEDAPLTVDNFIKLARSNYFNGIEIHRVVPNFVVQDGDPRGDGNGGPGWSIRCEINMLPYNRGAVGMALSGKDTGGSQWFATHSPQPHLDGGYTVFGHVNETDMKLVDNIVRGDKIISVKIIEVKLPQKGSRRAKR